VSKLNAIAHLSTKNMSQNIPQTTMTYKV